ncbi:MAG TPA: hypothetical protein VKN76_12400 [Kiloniellaceae bacterium]|nr:hypothetical protein [Kiloniellaceae bacterium]
MDPADFDVAYFRWPLWRLLVYINLRNIHIKDEHLETEKSRAMASISRNGFI